MTNEEARDQIIGAARHAAWYWATMVDDDTPCVERIEGAIFSFLAALDGVSQSLPACDIVVLESDDDGNTIGEQRVSTMLHEFLYADGWNAKVMS